LPPATQPETELDKEISINAELTDAVCALTSIYTPPNLGGLYGATQSQQQRSSPRGVQSSGRALESADGDSASASSCRDPSRSRDPCTPGEAFKGCLAPCSCRFTLTSSTIKPKLRTFGLCAGTIMVECPHSREQQQQQSADCSDPLAPKWEEVPALLIVMQHSLFIAQVAPNLCVGLAGPQDGVGGTAASAPASALAGGAASLLLPGEAMVAGGALKGRVGDGLCTTNMSLHSFPVPFCESCSKSQQQSKQVIACSRSGTANMLRTFQLPSLYEALRSQALSSPVKPRVLNPPQDALFDSPDMDSSSVYCYCSQDVLLAGWLHKWPMRSQYFGSRTRRFFALVAPLRNSSLPSMLLYWKNPPAGFVVSNESLGSNIATCEADIQIDPSTCRGRFLVTYKCVLSRKKSSLYGESIIALSNDIDELEIACLSEAEDAKWYRALCELLFVERNSRELKLFSKINLMCGTYERVKTTGANRKKRLDKRKQPLDELAGAAVRQSEIEALPSNVRTLSGVPVFSDPPITIFDPAFLSVREMSNVTAPDSKLILNPNCPMKSTQVMLRDVSADVSSTNYSVCFARIEFAKNDLGSKRVESSQGGSSVHVKTPGESLSASLDSSSELTVATTALDEGSTSDRTSAFQFRRHIDTFGRVNMMPAVSVDSSMETFDTSKLEDRFFASLPSNYGSQIKVEPSEFRRAPQFSGGRNKILTMSSTKNNDWTRSPNSSFCCTLFSTEELGGLSRDPANRAFYVQICRSNGQATLHKLVGPSNDDALRVSISAQSLARVLFLTSLFFRATREANLDQCVCSRSAWTWTLQIPRWDSSRVATALVRFA
jgi:hypothetical protein